MLRPHNTSFFTFRSNFSRNFVVITLAWQNNAWVFCNFLSIWRLRKDRILRDIFGPDLYQTGSGGRWGGLFHVVWRGPWWKVASHSSKYASSKQHRGKTSTHAPGWAFLVSFSVTLSSQIKVSRALSASFCVQLVVQLFCFMLLVFLTIL